MEQITISPSLEEMLSMDLATLRIVQDSNYLNIANTLSDLTLFVTALHAQTYTDKRKVLALRLKLDDKLTRLRGYITTALYIVLASNIVAHNHIQTIQKESTAQ